MINRRAFVLGLGATVALPDRLAAAEALSIPFQLRLPRMVVNGSIAGQGPYGFVFDTGGITSLIDSKIARMLKLEPRGSARLGMAGKSGSFDGAVARDLVLGNALAIPEMTFASTSLINFERGLVGTLGVEFMTQHAGHIDFDNGIWHLFQKGFPNLGGYEAQPGAMMHSGDSRSAFIFATVMLNDAPVRLALDTGFPGTIRLTPQALRRTGLDHRDIPILKPAPGKTAGKLPAVRATRASLGRIDLGQPVILRGDRGSDTYPDGIMGIRLISMFNFAADPATGTLWFKRNGLAPLEEVLYPAN